MVITSNVNILIEHGLGERGESNFRLVHDTCNTLLKIAPTKTSTTDPEPPFRYPLDHELFLRLEKLLTDGFDKLEDQHYIPMIQQSIAVIYQLSELPDKLAGSLCRNLAAHFASKKKDGEMNQVWPLTQFFLFLFCENSLLCLEGKSITPHRGNTVIFRSSQQLPRLRLVCCFRNYRDTRTPSSAPR